MKLRYHVVSTIKVIVEFTENMSLTQSRGATANLSQARPNILPQNFLTGCFLYKRIESQNLGKAQALGALPAMAALGYVINGLINQIAFWTKKYLKFF